MTSHSASVIFFCASSVIFFTLLLFILTYEFKFTLVNDLCQMISSENKKTAGYH